VPLRPLKILVVVMGAMLVAGVVVLVVAIANRVGRPAGGTAGSRPFVAAPLDLPPGARIETMSLGSDRLALAVVLPDGERRLVIIDLASGRQLGTIPLRAGP
jgi:uncharacterized protein DUF6476